MVLAITGTPSRRARRTAQAEETSAGYRVYSTQDLQALEQVVVLKFIGIPLRTIAALRSATTARLAESLRAVQEWDSRMASFVDKPVWDFMTRVLAARP